MRGKNAKFLRKAARDKVEDKTAPYAVYESKLRKTVVHTNEKNEEIRRELRNQVLLKTGCEKSMYRRIKIAYRRGILKIIRAPKLTVAKA